jgi:hypothetical protein
MPCCALITTGSGLGAWMLWCNRSPLQRSQLVGAGAKHQQAITNSISLKISDATRPTHRQALSLGLCVCAPGKDAMMLAKLKSHNARLTPWLLYPSLLDARQD